MTHKTNPFDWKREHRIALVLAAALGAFISTIVMFQGIATCAGAYTGSHQFYPIFGIDWPRMLGACWFSIIIRPIVGAGFGATFIYIWQLMRS